MANYLNLKDWSNSTKSPVTKNISFIKRNSITAFRISGRERNL